MSESDSSEESTPLNGSRDPKEWFIMISHYFQCTMTLVTFIYGVISWCLIRKFRNFNNYVYLSATLVNILRLAVGTLTLIKSGFSVPKSVENINLYFFIFMFLSAVYNYWLVVLCYMFYVDIVKVFDIKIKRKYLKSSLFAWGVPLLLLVISRSIFLLVELTEEDKTEKRLLVFARACIRVTSYAFPTIINSIFYVKLVYSLFSCKNAVNVIIPRKERIKQNVSRLCIATAMFILNNIFVLTMVLWDLFHCTNVVRSASFCLQVIVLSLFFPLLKSNRTSWYEHYKRKESVRQLVSRSSSSSLNQF